MEKALITGVSLALAGALLTACNDTSNDCEDASGSVEMSLVAAVDGKGGGRSSGGGGRSSSSGKGGSGKSKGQSGGSGSHGHSRHDDCDDD